MSAKIVIVVSLGRDTNCDTDSDDYCKPVPPTIRNTTTRHCTCDDKINTHSHHSRKFLTQTGGGGRGRRTQNER